MKRPIIGITCGEDFFENNVIQKVNHDYIQAIIQAHGIPVLLPICDRETLLEQISVIDGLLVPGGNDINPLTYGEDAHLYLGQSQLHKDLYEIDVIKEVSEMNKPIFGICRGLQLINVAFGGTLYQDLPHEYKNVTMHTQKEKPCYPIHFIEIEPYSFLSKICHESTYVNSFHHQAIKDVAGDFLVVARTHDYVIEAIQHKHKKIYGVQFHPEKMVDNQEMKKLFQFFVHECENTLS